MIQAADLRNLAQHAKEDGLDFDYDKKLLSDLAEKTCRIVEIIIAYWEN